MEGLGRRAPPERTPCERGERIDELGACGREILPAGAG
jgi:hypothetical protein